MKVERIQVRQAITIKTVGHVKIKNVGGSAKMWQHYGTWADFSGSLYLITGRERPNKTPHKVFFTL
jgi:hypothetical protein